MRRARTFEARAVARLISLVENQSGRDVAAACLPYLGHARVIGITGSPGVGKSTSTAALVSMLRAKGSTVAVLAVDPSSPFSGGALLGDRIRMQEHATDPGVFIRSMATRGHLGGLATAAPQALRVLDAAGFDVILIETVGVGQSEVEVVELADTTVVLLAPGMGDAVQAAKAGILEVADLFVVNKADRDGADQVVRDLRYMQSLGGGHSLPGSWRPPIVKAVAARGENFPEIVAALNRHQEYLHRSGELTRRRTSRAGAEVEAIALDVVRQRFEQIHGSAGLLELAGAVAAGELDPFTAADRLVASLS